MQNQAQAIRARKKQSMHGWKGGLFAEDHNDGEPSRGSIDDTDYRPILSIPLQHVHICTLHANNRMVEKMLHLHFMTVWNMPNKVMQKSN